MWWCPVLLLYMQCQPVYQVNACVCLLSVHANPLPRMPARVCVQFAAAVEAQRKEVVRAAVRSKLDKKLGKFSPNDPTCLPQLLAAIGVQVRGC